MKKEKDFKVNLISVQRASNKNMDSKYHVLGEVKKVRKKRTNGTEYAEDTTVKKRERKKHVTVDISNLHNDSLDENKEAKGFEVIPSKRRGRKPKKLMANEVLIEDVLKGASSEEKLSVAQQQPLLKENQIKDDFIGFLNRRTEEIKSVFSEIKDYISTLLKVIDDKDKELIEVKARLETEITTVSNTIKEAQKTQENISVIQEKLDQKNIQIKRLESEIEKLKSKGSKKVNLVKKNESPSAY